jgi:ribose/xylose/arabinose/galactoside ABC-type transport system permease subunit
MLILESIGALSWGGGGVAVDKSYEFFNKPVVVVIITTMCFLAAYFLYCHAKYGYNLRAVGSNITVAETQGINVTRIKIESFVVAGLFSSFYAVLSLGKSCVQNPITNMGSMDMVFNAIMCCFVAMALEQRICLVTGVFIGSFTVQLIKLGIVALGVSGQFNNSAIAITLLVFCAVNSNSEYINAIRNIFHKTEKPVYGKSL